MRKTIIFLAILCIPAYIFAQTLEINGTVSDESTGEALIGVNIFNQSTETGSITDLDGNYTIQASPGDLLRFSYIGYYTEEVTVGTSTNINVVLREDIHTLDEIVVIGYGRIKKSDLTGAVSSVRGEDLTKITSVSPEQALQGKVAGLQVSSSSGDPGASPTVRIRGVGTFGNPNPIFVVDGVILDNISFLNSSDISSIEVLKDASSTAMYGSRGANGVIIVTTKSGSNQDKVQVNLNANYELQTIEKYIDMLDAREFAQILNRIQPGSFNNLDLLENYDWQRMVYRNFAPMQSYQLSGSGGGERSSFYASAGYFNQEGVVPGSAYERLTLKINNDYKFTDHIRIGHNLTISNYKKNNAPNIVASTLRAWPTDPGYEDDGTFYGNRGNGNPLASLEYSDNTFSGIRGVGNFYGEVNFLKDFTFRSSFGFDIEESEGVGFTPIFFVTPQQNNDETSLYKNNNSRRDWLWENTLNYHRESGVHSLDLLAGYTAQERNSEGLSVSGKNLLREDIHFLSNDMTDIIIGNSGNIWSMVSYLFRANYVYDSKYMFTTTFRADGSSAFASGNRWGYFPSVAAGWRISEEDFFTPGTVSNLKLRGSYGVVGNDKVNTTNRYTLIMSGRGAVFGTDEVFYPGSTYGTSGNPLIRWEEAVQGNFGAEVGMWNNKLVLEADVYHKITKDILIGLQTPGHIGNGTFATVTYNAANVMNRGIELAITWKESRGDFFYEFNATGSTVHNEALALSEDAEADHFLIMGSLGNGQNVKRVTPGYSIGYFYGYNVLGVFQNQEELDAYPHLSLTQVGDFKYEDINDDGSITTDDMTYIGTPVPAFVYGFAGTMRYGGLSVAIDFQGELGKDIYDGKDAVRAGQYNYQQRVANAWNDEGSTNTEPRATSSTLNYNPSTWFVFDGSYLRLRNISVGYDLPSRWMNSINISRATIFLKGTNVLTLTKYPGYTADIGGSVQMNGIDTGVYPVTSVYGGGVNVTF
ncbi:MAG: TonB-dependent receptor [Bacteroidales bacterium]